MTTRRFDGTFPRLVDKVDGLVATLVHAPGPGRRALKFRRSADVPARRSPARLNVRPQSKPRISRAGRVGQRVSRNATRPPVTGYGRAGGVTASLSRSCCAAHGMARLCTNPRQAHRCDSGSNGTKRLRNVGNAYDGRSVPGRAAPPSAQARRVGHRRSPLGRRRGGPVRRGGDAAR